MTDTNHDSYTVKDICRILNVSRTRAYEIFADHDNPPPYLFHKIGKLIRIHKKSFDNWFNGNPNDTEFGTPAAGIHAKGER